MAIAVGPGETLLVFGGPYSNLEATQAVLAEAARRGVPASRTVCTGDVVAYGADAQATVDLVRAAGIPVVMGNCEESLGNGAADCGCGFTEGSACDLLSVAWFAHADRTLDGDGRAWMTALPQRIDVAIGGRQLAVIHGGVGQMNRFIFESTPADNKAAELKEAEADGVIAGHCGIPFSQIIGEKLWHNAGAVGMPANDGTARVWFSTLRDELGGIRVEHHALTYDHERAAAKMRTAGLPAGYADGLASGRWPSCDILPATEVAATGKPIAPNGLFWKQDRAV